MADFARKRYYRDATGYVCVEGTAKAPTDSKTGRPLRQVTEAEAEAHLAAVKERADAEMAEASDAMRQRQTDALVATGLPAEQAQAIIDLLRPG